MIITCNLHIPYSNTQPTESLDVTWSPTASYIVTASDDKTLRLWSAETGDAFVEFRGHGSFVFTCKFNPQSNLLVSGVSSVDSMQRMLVSTTFLHIIRHVTYHHCYSLSSFFFLSSHTTKPSNFGIFGVANAWLPCQHILVLLLG